MLIKYAEDRSQDVETLKKLLEHPDASERTRKQIEQQISAILSGMQGEKEAAYEINFYFETSPNWIVIHDLRLEVDGKVAQIDHLLIDRFLDVWVCESKRYSGGIAINEYGECTTFYGKKAYGIGSPLEQNEKHKQVLKRFFAKHKQILPTRLRIAIPPKLRSVILVSKNARISRPKTGREKYENVFKADQIKTRIFEEYGKQNNPLYAAKVISSSTLVSFGKQLVKFHRPHQTDWYARFGLQPPQIVVETAASEQNCTPVSATPHPKAIKPRLFCGDCSATITVGIIRYCKANSAKFSNKLLCMDCQKKYD